MPWAIFAYANYIKLPWCDRLFFKPTFIKVNRNLCRNSLHALFLGSQRNSERKNLLLWDDFQLLLFKTILSPSARSWHIAFQMQQQSRCLPRRHLSSHYFSWYHLPRALSKTGLADVFDFSSDTCISPCHCFPCFFLGLYSRGCFHPKFLRFVKRITGDRVFNKICWTRLNISMNTYTCHEVTISFLLLNDNKHYVLDLGVS